jgi:hypothetical protein
MSWGGPAESWGAPAGQKGGNDTANNDWGVNAGDGKNSGSAGGLNDNTWDVKPNPSENESSTANLNATNMDVNTSAGLDDGLNHSGTNKGDDMGFGDDLGFADGPGHGGNRSAIVCHICNKEGHMRKECPEKPAVTCRNCTEEGRQ